MYKYTSGLKIFVPYGVEIFLAPYSWVNLRPITVNGQTLASFHPETALFRLTMSIFKIFRRRIKIRLLIIF